MSGPRPARPAPLRPGRGGGDTGASRPWFSDMSQAQTPDDAAVDVVWPATLPAGTRDPHGVLVQHRRVLPWT